MLWFLIINNTNKNNSSSNSNNNGVPFIPITYSAVKEITKDEDITSGEYKSTNALENAIFLKIGFVLVIVEKNKIFIVEVK